MEDPPDPGLFRRYCEELLVGLLMKWQVEPDAADAIAADVLQRGEAAAALDAEYLATLLAPFTEEVFDHTPPDAPVWLKAATTLVVRNSELEELHVAGVVNEGGIQGLTEYAVAPLSHLLAARRREPAGPPQPDNPFVGLDASYPRTWACLHQLVRPPGEGGRFTYHAPTAPVPPLPGPEEGTEARQADIPSSVHGIVLSGVDPRFDQRAIDLMRQADSEAPVMPMISALSRFSRNSNKLLRMLEFFLARSVPVLTTNYLLDHAEVWIRTGPLVKPVSADPIAGLRHLTGLTGRHRDLVRSVLAEQGVAPHPSRPKPPARPDNSRKQQRKSARASRRRNR